MMMKLMHVVTATAAALLLTACGGGGGDIAAEDESVSQAANEVPASATATATTYAIYAGSLALSETGAPMDIGKVVPPTSETDAPIEVR
jgi:outer membrane biogenesis lipoprotein LolB